MKKRLIICLALLGVVALGGESFSEAFLADEVKKEVNNAIVLKIGSSMAMVNGLIKESDSMPYLKNERTMVPLRFISENMGAEVNWYPELRQIKIKSDKEISLTLDKTIIKINDTESIVEVAPEILNNRAFVPLRAISEALGKSVYYEQGVIIIKNESIDKSMAWKNIILNYAQANLKNEYQLYTESCYELSYKLLIKNPDNYLKNKVKYRGKILEIYERPADDGILTFFRLDVTRNRQTSFDSQVLFITHRGSCPFVEGDTVNIYGEVVGTYDYISQLGYSISLPWIHAKHYNVLLKSK